MSARRNILALRIGILLCLLVQTVLFFKFHDYDAAYVAVSGVMVILFFSLSRCLRAEQEMPVRHQLAEKPE